MADEKTNAPAAPDEGFLHSLATSLGIDPEAVKTAAKAFYTDPVTATKEVGSEIASESSDIAAHPIQSAKDVGRGVAAQLGVNPDAQATAKQRFSQPGAGNKISGAIEYLESGIPLIGGNLAKGEEQVAQGNLPGGLGTTIGTIAPLLTDTEPVNAAKAAVKNTAVDLATNISEGVKAGADMALNAKAPEGSLEAGFAKIGGKKVKEPTPQPQHAYRARPVGQEGIGTDSHAQATVSQAEAKKYAENLEDMSGKPHEVVRVDLNKVKPETYTRHEGPQGNDWIQFHEPVDEKLVEKTDQPAAESPEEKYEQTLARRGQLPNQTVNMSEAYGDTGKYVGGLVKSRGQKIAESVAPSTPSVATEKETKYHPDLQKLIDNETTNHRAEIHSDPTTAVAPGEAHFILPDGKFLRLKGVTHDKAIADATGRSASDDVRVGFINDTGAIRMREGAGRAGSTLHFSVPKDGVTPKQIDAIKQSVGKNRNGNVMLERADVKAETKDALTQGKELARPADIEPMLHGIDAHPDKAATAQHVLANAPAGVLKADDPKATAVKKLVENNGGVFRGMQVDQAGDKRVGQIYIDVPPDRVGGKKNVTAGVAIDKATPENIKAAVDKMAAQHAPEVTPNETLQGSAQKYAKARGMEPIDHSPVKVDAGRAKEIASIYDKAQHEPTNPRVKTAYDALKKETLAQFHHLRDDLGLKFEPQEQDPYSSAGEMMDDVRRNNRLKVFTGSSTGEDHPLSEVAPGTGGHTYNTVFRWVHDAMGHAAGGNDFSEAGEKSATEAHAQMYSDAARPAMRAETEGQTSWFFHNPEVESGAKQPGQFAEQKATILPDTSADWHEKAGASAAKDEAGGINPRTGKSDSKGMGTEIMPELRQALDHAPTAQDFKNFYDQHKDIFDQHPELRVGWDNKSAVEGGHEINVGAVGPDAARVAKKLDQKSAFNIAKGEVVPTGGTGLRTSFPNYPIEERIKDLTNQPHSTRSGFEHISDEIYKNLEPDERKYVEGNKNLQRNVMAQYHKIAPSINETTNAMQAGAALGGWWQRYIDTFHGLLDTDAEKVANTIGPSHAEILKQWHAALSANKSVEDANNLAWHTYADWLDAGKPTDRESINDIVLKNGAQPEGVAKKGNAAISDTLGKRGKIVHEGIDTSKLYNLVNSPEMRGARPFSGDVFNDDDAKNPLMGKGEGYRKVPSMGATVAGKGNLNRLVIDTHIADFYGQSVKGTAARYIADSAHMRQAAKALGLKGGEGQEQLWGTVLGLKTLLKEGLTPEEAGGKLNAETINKIGKDYAEVIANDPEITKPGGLLDRLKEKYGIGVGSAGAGAADSAARSTRASESRLTGSEATVDPALTGESARRIRGQISESKIKKPAAPPEDEDTSFEFGANVKPKTPSPKPAGKPSKTMSAMELIQALSGLSKPGSKK